MAIIKQLNKKTGITYVYESRSFRDKETKQPRSERRLIGRIDDATGEIVPTRKKQKNITTEADGHLVNPVEMIPNAASVDIDLIREKDSVISEQRKEIARLQKEKSDVAHALEKLLKMLRS